MFAKTILLACTAALALVCPALSAEAQDTGEGISGRLALAPPVLLKWLAETPYLDQYTDRFLELLRRLDDGNGLDAADIPRAERNAAMGAREQQLADAYAYDLDGDGTIALSEVTTAAESEEAIALSPRKYLDRFMVMGRVRAGWQIIQSHEEHTDPLSKFKALDANQDGVVDFDEARRLAPEVRAAAAAGPVREIQALLFVDPSRDKHITAEDMKVIARRTFAAFDRNNDGVIEDAERDDLMRHVRVEPTTDPYLFLMSVPPEAP